MRYSRLGLPVAAIMAVCSLALVSCASIDQTVKIAPLPAGLPVSGSQSLYVDGRTVDPSQMQVLKEFSYDKAFSSRMKAKEVELMLSEDLVRLAQEAGGNGIVKLKIAVLGVQSTDMGLIWLERYVGSLSAVVGISLMLQPGTSDGSSSQSMTTGGAIMAGAGVALVGGSFLHESVGTVNYSFHISGTVVRYSGWPATRGARC